MDWLISKIISLALIAAGIALEIIWVTFLFGSVLGIVLLLIFAPTLFFAPLMLSVLGINMLIKND